MYFLLIFSMRTNNYNYTMYVPSSHIPITKHQRHFNNIVGLKLRQSIMDSQKKRLKKLRYLISMITRTRFWIHAILLNCRVKFQGLLNLNI